MQKAIPWNSANYSYVYEKLQDFFYQCVEGLSTKRQWEDMERDSHQLLSLQKEMYGLLVHLPAIKPSSLAGYVGQDIVLLTFHFGFFHHSHSSPLANKMDNLFPGWWSQHLGGFGVWPPSPVSPFPWEGVKTGPVSANCVGMAVLIYNRWATLGVHQEVKRPRCKTMFKS